MSIPAFTSLSAHNGCRALFNGTEGWAYFGPTGLVNATDFPGAVSYDYRRLKEPPAPGRPPVATAVARTEASSRRPGEWCGRKVNHARNADSDAEDLGHIIDEARRSARCTGGSEPEGVQRTGRPIVITLQAILAANSDNMAGMPEAALRSGTGTNASQSGREPAAAATRAMTEECGEAPRMTDETQFPPLMLRGASGGRSGLFLAPPITMFKNRTDSGVATDDSNEGSAGGVTCSEAVAATHAAEAAEAGHRSGVNGTSRVGWWLRWATSADDSRGDVAGGPTGEGGAVGGKASERSFPVTSVTNMDVGDDEPDPARGCHNSIDDWHMIHPEAAGDGRTPDASMGTPLAMPPRPLPRSATGGGVWSIVAGIWRGSEKRGEDEGNDNAVDDDASWCDCASDVEAHMLCSDGAGAGAESALDAIGSGVDREGITMPGSTDSSEDSACVSDDDDDELSSSSPLLEAAASSRAPPDAGAGIVVWDAEHGNRNDDDSLGRLVSRAGPWAQVPQGTVQTRDAPRSFLETLMSPSPGGSTTFLDRAGRTRAAASTSAGSRLPAARPTLVNRGGDGGGAVFAWREAASGKGERAGDKCYAKEEEDPYYARKRVGAFAYQTKPRGKAHK